jgi:hypothetical protein
MKKRLFQLFGIVFILGICDDSLSQEALEPRLSPMAVATMKYEDSYIKVTYGRPHKRDRKIFGELVPYGEVWRTGANEATEITVTEDILIGGKKLRSGTYTIFTIPDKDTWTIIFNSELGQWGAYNYDSTKDLLRIEAKVGKTDQVYEPFTIEFKQKEDGADLVMMWDRTIVSVPIQF